MGPLSQSLMNAACRFPLFDPPRVHATLSRFLRVTQLLQCTSLGRGTQRLCPATEGTAPASAKDAYVDGLNTFLGAQLPFPSACPLAVDGIVVLEYAGTPTARRDVVAKVSDALAYIRRGWPEIHALVCDVVAAIVVTVRPNFVGGSMTGLGVFWMEEGLTTAEMANIILHEYIHIAINMEDAVWGLFAEVLLS